jgi:hypothetical protein
MMGTLAAAMHRVKLRLKFLGSIGGAVTSREHQAGFDPGLTGAGAVSVLLLLADLECGDAQARQGEGCFRCLGLDLAAEELLDDRDRAVATAEGAAVR